MTIRFFVFRQNVAYLCEVIFISTMRKMYLFAAFISAFVLAACGGDSTSSKVEPVINVTPLELNVSSLGEDKTINVEATCMWEADTDVDWITLSRTKGGLDDRMCVAKIAENKTASSRSATIAFSNSAYALVQRVKVVQDGYTVDLVCPEDIEVDYQSGSKTIAVRSNVDFKFSKSQSDWLTVSKSNNNLSFVYSENQSEEAREAVITLSNADYNISEQFRFVQGGKPQSGGSDTPGGEDGEVVFYEDFDAQTATYNGDSYVEDYVNPAGSGAADVFYDYSSVLVRSNIPTDDDGYSNYAGSGVNNLHFQSDASLEIHQISLPATQDKYELTFGAERYIKNEDNTFDNSEFHVYLSQDGASWVEINYAMPAGADTDGRFDMATASFRLKEVPSHLSVMFVSDLSKGHRLDDVKLTAGGSGEQVVSLEAEIVEITTSAKLSATTAPYGGATLTLTMAATAGKTYVAKVASGSDWCKFEGNATTLSGEMTAYRNSVEADVNVAYNSATAARQAKITVEFSDGKSFNFTISQEAKPESGGSGDVGDVVLYRDWAELPVCNEREGFDYVVHGGITVGGKSNQRNFTICFDREHKLATWVAYPLHDAHIGSTGRTEDWQYGPGVPTQYQPNLSKSYTGNYDRGHQIPSGDRTGSKEMNRPTFYYSNMTPQASQFNQGGWASLENDVRSEICSDTLYVVTGALFLTTNDSSIAKSTTDRDGKTCPIPSHYYKVLLRTKSGNTGKAIKDITNASDLKAIAILIKHKSTCNIQNSDYISISELERQSGYTFFPALNDAIEDEVKSQCNPSAWF